MRERGDTTKYVELASGRQEDSAPLKTADENKVPTIYIYIYIYMYIYICRYSGVPRLNKFRIAFVCGGLRFSEIEHP